eukprot:764818-Hanusia_phi.AAC.5
MQRAPRSSGRGETATSEYPGVLRGPAAARPGLGPEVAGEGGGGDQWGMWGSCCTNSIYRTDVCTKSYAKNSVSIHLRGEVSDPTPDSVRKFKSDPTPLNLDPIVDHIPSAGLATTRAPSNDSEVLLTWGARAAIAMSN